MMPIIDYLAEQEASPMTPIIDFLAEQEPKPAIPIVDYLALEEEEKKSRKQPGKSAKTLEIERLLMAGELSRGKIARRFDVSTTRIDQIKRSLLQPSRAERRQQLGIEEALQEVTLARAAGA